MNGPDTISTPTSSSNKPEEMNTVLPSVEAALRFGLLREAGAVPGRDRGLRCIALLVAPTAGSRAYGTADAAGLCEALREAPEE
jgi:hypothetical protein